MVCLKRKEKRQIIHKFKVNMACVEGKEKKIVFAQIQGKRVKSTNIVKVKHLIIGSLAF